MLRISRPSNSYASLCDYKIYIDDVYCGYVRNADIKEINVEDGEHSIYIKSDFSKSNRLIFTVKDNELVELTCGNSIKGVKKLFLFVLNFIILFINFNLFVKIAILSLLCISILKMQQFFIKFTDDM